jgi:hypothetical protein
VKGQTILVLGLLALAGCAGKGETIILHLQDARAGVETTTKKADTLSVAVLPFEDKRVEKTRLGTRSHFWGGESYFNLPNGKSGEVIAQTVAEYLTSKGWRAEVVKSGGGAAATMSDVTLTGQVLDLAVNARSRFGSTALTTKTAVAIQALNRADGSAVRMTLTGDGSQTVLWFEPKDAQALLSDIVVDSLEKFLRNTKVQNKTIRLK